MQSVVNYLFFVMVDYIILLFFYLIIGEKIIFLLNYIEEKNLCFSEKESNGGNVCKKVKAYILAYEKDVALFRYAESGDNFEIKFNLDNGDILWAEYTNSKNLCSALYYHYGTYFNFHFANPENRYQGYYFTDHFTKGREVEFENGNKSQVGYDLAINAEDAISKTLMFEKTTKSTTSSNPKTTTKTNTTTATMTTTTTTTTKTTATTTVTTTTEPEPVALSYVLNNNTMKFHKPTCKSVKDIKPENRQDFTGDRADLIAQGYSPCGNCHP